MAAKEMNQMTFDDLLNTIENEVKETLDKEPIISKANKPAAENKASAQVEVAKKNAKRVEKPVLNQKIKDKWSNVKTFQDLSEFGVIASFAVFGNNITYQRNERYTFRLDDRWGNGLRYIDSNKPFHLYYVDDNARVWEASVKLSIDHKQRIISIHEKSEMKVLERFHESSIGCYQSNQELLDFLKDKKPWTYKYFFEDRNSENGYNGVEDPDPLTILAAPELESLIKAGYIFAEKFVSVLKPSILYNPQMDQARLDNYNRLIKKLDNPGKLKNIFKTSQAVCKVLKNERDLSIWDNFRKMDKFGRLGNNEIQLAYDARLSRKQLDQISSILGRRYENKQIFTFPSLMAYLQRVDMYEAISTAEALILIDDYLRQCQYLNIKPKIDGDSLKREHDVVSRNYRIAASVNRNAEDKAREKVAVDKLRKYDYEEDLFFVRGIRSHEDLLNEANQQHNCVASYYRSILTGTSLIFVMREKRNPNQSLVTIELSPDGSRIKQKFLAYNRPIHNAAQTEFIKRWHKHVKDVMQKTVNPMTISEELNGYFDHVKSEKYENAYVYGMHQPFGYGMQPMENLLYQGTDPDGKFKAILKYSYPVKDSDLKKYNMELISNGEKKPAPVQHLNRNQGTAR